MQEFMNELGKKVTDVVKKIEKSTEPLVKKTEEMVEVQKVKSQIRALENNNEVDLFDLGEIVFAKYKDSLVIDEDFVAICEEIEERLEKIEELEKQVVELKGQEICTACGMVMSNHVFYCSHCGTKMEKKVEEDVVQEMGQESIFEEPVFEEPAFEEEIKETVTEEL